MSCKRGKASPNSYVKLKLFADSGGYCQNPGCNKNLFLLVGECDFHIAEMAHIFSASNKGPRAKKHLTKEERGQFDNLILLCPTCHTIIDKAESEYPDDLIKSWKTEHFERINRLFKMRICEDRDEIKSLIKPMLNENRMVFETYGPLIDERFNPESESPIKWNLKIYSIILPNNRKILNIIEINYSLLSQDEEIVFEQFRQHVNDFEAKHLNKEELNGVQFPVKMNQIFD